MKRSAPIRILARESNHRGDLFARLMADLFVALGYEQPRLNIHKAGRELDVDTQHRLEPRRAIAECKATSTPIGGDEVNTFVGRLDAERKGKGALTGYFISLAGFRETAVEQEKQGRRTPIVLLDGERVINELVQGRIIIPMAWATELAGRCCAASFDLALDVNAELLAHERGWIWCVYYTRGKLRTHFALIHSDGTPLARALVDEVVAADRTCNGGLHRLESLKTWPSHSVASKAEVRQALVAYRVYLEGECGYIQLDGLPADSDVGSRRLRLENLFVPLHLDVDVGPEGQKTDRRAVGAVLADQRVALLAPPGGGKSTLIKRLAIAYADPSRRGEIGDELPDCEWLPLFFRCRELRDLARRSFAELLDALSQREPVRQHAAAFRAHVDAELLRGRVLLLVDGLDEISDPGDRAAFVCTLRTALQAYPGTAFVVTSREAGFRHVASHLAPVCLQATLSAFDKSDIRRLSVAWHTEVIGDTPRVRADAEELAATIAENDRISQLAINPLLLTTLLLVRRWVGSLPTRRAVLYGKAVEVLLMTWNTEGHDPIPQEEALPQLCYVGAAMMFEGIQTISRPKLAALLQESRDSLPTELGYVEGSVEDFIHRVEDRSSLLMMTGLDVESGQLVEFFEFRHLTFQEYLTALALVKGWHPGRQDEDTLVSVLSPYLNNSKWREVIPLAAVLGGKETESLIRVLTHESEGLLPTEVHAENEILTALGNCLADEAAARPETIRAAISTLVSQGSLFSRVRFTRSIANGRYGNDLRAEARRAFLACSSKISESASVLADTVWWQTLKVSDTTGLFETAQEFLTFVDSRELLTRCEGALGFMELSFTLRRETPIANSALAGSLTSAGTALTRMASSDAVVEQFCALWALAWLGELRTWIPPTNLIERLYTLWRSSPDEEVREKAGWALATQPLTAREVQLSSIMTAEMIHELLQSDTTTSEKTAGLVAAWYSRVIPDEEIVRSASKLVKQPSVAAYIGSYTLRNLAEMAPLHE
jgi:hypothetical protein